MEKFEIAKEILSSLNEYLKTLQVESQQRIQYDDTDYYKGKISASYQVQGFIRNEFSQYMED